MTKRSKNAVRAAKLIPSLGVSDIARSVAFYRDFFGFEIEDSYEQDGGMRWCWLKTRGADLMLQQLTSDQQITLHPAIGQSWVLYIQPADLPATHMQLSQAGLAPSEIAKTAYGASEFFLDDPDGYELWVSAPAASAEEGYREPDDDEGEEEEEDDEDDEEEEEWQVRN